MFESHLHCPSREVVDFISICKPLKVIECPAIRLGGLPGLMLGRNLKDCERGRTAPVRRLCWGIKYFKYLGKEKM